MVSLSKNIYEPGVTLSQSVSQSVKSINKMLYLSFLFVERKISFPSYWKNERERERERER